MSWHDPAHTQEPMEDCDLREELSQLLGFSARSFFEAEPTPRMIALAEDLRREALRRRHTSRQRPVWMLMAAALPLALAIGALGSWGFQHKQRADAMTAAVAQKEVELQNLAKAAAASQAARVQPVLVMAPVVPAQNLAQKVASHGKVSPRPNGELVLEVKTYQTPALDTQPVKGQ